MERSNYETALANDEMGYVSIPIVHGTKTPFIRWKRWQTERPSRELYRLWFTGANVRNNIAIICTDVVIFDVDDVAHLQKVLAECGDTPHKLLTPRGGVHLGYRRRQGVALRNQVDIKGLQIDIRTNGGLELIPRSHTEHGDYSWIGEGLRPRTDLPIAKIGWTRERRRSRIRQALTPSAYPPSDRGSIRNPEAYCLRIESIQGQNGSRGLVRVVCVLRDAGRTPEEAFAFIKGVWGPSCAEPEWSDTEIWHAINRHYGIA